MPNAVEHSFKGILASIAQRTGPPMPKTMGGKKEEPIWLAVAVIGLLALVAVAYTRTLGSYFLADDFGEVAYVSRILNGEWNLFWANWTGNYMQIPGMAVYRPWLLVSLLTDCAVWHANAFGYYLTNILHFAADVLLLFAVVRNLTTTWGSPRSLLASFFTAALFAVNPLHCESNSWVVGRVDSACCTYFLAGLLLFLQSRKQSRRLYIGAAVLCFWLGILTKEMAIVLPLLVFAVSFFLPRKAETEDFASETFSPGLFERFFSALKESAPFWLSTIAYFGLRFAVLKTLTGGYTGGIGDDQTNAALAHWLDLGTYQRLAFPLAADIFPFAETLKQCLATCYVGLTILGLLRAIRKDLPVSLLGILSVWVIAAALPLYKLWGLGLNLEGARFCFFLTIPLAAAPCLLLFAPAQRGTNPNGKAELVLVSALLLVLAGIDLKVLTSTNSSWVHAGREVKTLTLAIVQLTNAVPAEKHVAILGVPKTHVAAHMIYNGHTLMTALKPPFTSVPCDSRIETFDPLFFGHSEYINSTRLRSLIQNGHVTDAYVWNRLEKRLVPCGLHSRTDSTKPIELALDLSKSTQVYSDGHATAQGKAGTVSLHNVLAGDGIQFHLGAVLPTDYDFLEFEYRSDPGELSPDSTFAAKWAGSANYDGNSRESVASLPTSTARDASKEWKLMRMPLSHYWHWFTQGQITDIALLVPPVPNVEIRAARLVSDKQLRPLISMDGTQPDNAGVHYVRAGSKLTVSAVTIPTAKSIQVECSKANYFFDQANSHNLHDFILSSNILNSPEASMAIDGKTSPINGFCELRARALDANGKPVGEFSEPILLFVSK